ncbi:hypothetical protein [Archangium violaceum]|uniref:Lipoprotein n=1 Tax=Archangium violaceum Cb vi76 TaxID=1406225 RepID=A0A084SZH3_9BACT|nr:hypothetical protein [Archangium violaceum]KFA93858.1 hypothetical protein Q664_06745 [Archangium violaceum Cb vi76]
MKKLPALIAIGVLGLSGCASSSGALAEGELPLEDLMNETEVAQRSRADAPTVYNGEATGGAGHTVTTGDGRIWAPEIAPGNTVTRTQSDTWRGLQETDGAQSVIIDEGPTREGSQ